MKIQIILIILFTNVNSKINETLDIRGKSALFIGDSYTANHIYGWQLILSKKTGVNIYNLSEVGKQSLWMVNKIKENIKPTYDYCFIYGGMNDIYGSKNPYYIVKNIQQIVNLCNSKNIKPVVLIGFNAEECIQSPKGKEIYPKLYTQYQKILINNIKNAVIIDTRVINRQDCGDWLCHLNKTGHLKIANAVIKQMKIKTL